MNVLQAVYLAGISRSRSLYTMAKLRTVQICSKKFQEIGKNVAKVCGALEEFIECVFYYDDWLGDLKRI